VVLSLHNSISTLLFVLSVHHTTPPLPFLPTGLAPSAAAAMLAHSYSAVVPISPLPGAPLPLQLGQPGPTFYGPSSLSGSPWLHLALYAAAG
jgi:hypothetical protein